MKLTNRQCTATIETRPTGAPSESFTSKSARSVSFFFFFLVFFHFHFLPSMWLQWTSVCFVSQFRDALDAYSRAIRLNPYISEVWWGIITFFLYLFSWKFFSFGINNFPLLLQKVWPGDSLRVVQPALRLHWRLSEGVRPWPAKRHHQAEAGCDKACSCHWNVSFFGRGNQPFAAIQQALIILLQLYPSAHFLQTQRQASWLKRCTQPSTSHHSPPTPFW